MARSVLLLASAAAVAAQSPLIPQFPGQQHWRQYSSLPLFNITDYGAIGDNHTINTLAIQSAVNAASAALGGLVLIPPIGTFKTATISLADDVYLYIPAGAVLLGSSELSDYTAVSGADWGLWDVVHTINASRTGILGSLTGEGEGGVLQGPMWQMIDHYDPSQNQLEPVTWAGQFGCEGECRPRLVVFEDCADVSLTNIALRDSSDWTTLFRRTNRVLWENVTVWGSQQWPNNDGCDLESVTDAVFRNVSSFTGDDGICLSSGNTNNIIRPWPQPPGAYTPTTNVLIENCTLSSYSSAFKLEAIFQANHGDVTNVTVRDTAIVASNRGIGMQQRTGAGKFADIRFERVSIEARAIIGSNWWGMGEAIWLTSIPENGNLPAPLGGIHNVSFVNVTTISEQGVIVINQGQGNVSQPSGTAMIDGISFTNVSVSIGVLGNATRPGFHDWRPQDDGTNGVAANVTGFWFEHVGTSSISGASVSFIGTPQPFWQPNTCIAGTPDSKVQVSGLNCSPAETAVEEQS
jgi:hypothetical protein